MQTIEVGPFMIEVCHETVVIIHGPTEARSVAICHESDRFSKAKGTRLAMERALKQLDSRAERKRIGAALAGILKGYLEKERREPLNGTLRIGLVSSDEIDRFLGGLR